MKKKIIVESEKDLSPEKRAEGFKPEYEALINKWGIAIGANPVIVEGKIVAQTVLINTLNGTN